MTHLPWFLALCSPDGAIRGGLLVGLFLAGAAGSVMHCGPMCGVFVLGQVSDRMARIPASHMCELDRIRNGLLLPYHLGRLTTYAILGASAAGSASVLGHTSWYNVLAAVLLMLAAALFLTNALGRTGLTRAPAWWGSAIGQVTRRIPSGSFAGEAMLGLALGFLPCGFLYAAILAAAATGRPLLGAAAMIAFGLGTAPSLMVIGIAGRAAGRRWTHTIGKAAPGVMAFNAILLLLMAWQRMT